MGDRLAVPQFTPRENRHSGQGVCGRCPDLWLISDPNFAPGGFLTVALYVPLAGWIFWRHGQRRYLRHGSDRDRFQGLGAALLGLLTHILLDCFTTYGTQVFAPFSDVRAAGTISVVDPIYTLPFLICLLAAARFTGGQPPPLVERCGNRTEFAVPRIDRGQPRPCGIHVRAGC